MVFQLKDRDILIVSKGNAKIDNRKYKDFFLEIYLDDSLKEFDYVYPAAGSPNSAVKIALGKLKKVTKGSCREMCK